MQLQIQYFALLRDQRGLESETIESDAATPELLYQQLASQHGFTLTAKALKVAINDDFADWDTRLNEGDSVVFIPPVAGG